jgi:hypothetical protein
MGIPLQPLNIPQWALEAQQASPAMQTMRLAQGLSQVHAQNEGMRLRQQQMQQMQPIHQQQLQQMQAQTQLAQAKANAIPQQAQLQQQQLDHRIHVPSTGGLAGQYQTWMQLVRDYGPNSPQATQYKAMLDQQMANQTSSAKSRAITANSLRGFGSMATHQIMSQGQQLGYTAAEWAAKSPQERSNIVSNHLYNTVRPQQAGAPNQNVMSPEAQRQYGQTQSSIIKGTTPAAQQDRIMTSWRAQPIISNLQKLAPDVMQYAGKEGKAKLLWLKANASNSPEYKKYVNFTDVQLPALREDAANMLGSRNTDKAFNELQQMFKIDSAALSPKGASAKFKSLISFINQEANQNTSNLFEARTGIGSPLNQMPASLAQSQLPSQAAQPFGSAPAQAQAKMPTPNAPNNSYYVRLKSDPSKVKVVPASHIQQVLGSWGEIADGN